MSLSLQDLKDELHEAYLRTEEVLSVMDAYISLLEIRGRMIEGKLATIKVSISVLLFPNTNIEASRQGFGFGGWSGDHGA